MSADVTVQVVTVAHLFGLYDPLDRQLLVIKFKLQKQYTSRKLILRVRADVYHLLLNVQSTY